MPDEKKVRVKVPEDMLELIEKDPELRYLKQHNTGLTKKEFDEFYKWAMKEYGNDHQRLLYEMGTYDVQGAWKSGDVFKKDDRGHTSSRWKKPNHKTFSVDSKYSTPKNPGGRWVKTAYGTNFHPHPSTLELYGKDHLLEYFKKHERPNTKLMWQNPNTSY